jgi:hypothetical protein
MDSQGETQVLAERVERLEERCRRLHRYCRRLLYALAAVTVIALTTPAVFMIYTSFGKELRCSTLTAERIVLPYEGELVMQGVDAGQLRARLGHFSDGGWFGLAFFDRDTGQKHVLRLRGNDSPSLIIGPIHDWHSQLRIGYTDMVEPGVTQVIGDPLIDFVGHRGARQISLSVAGNGDPHFIIWDDDGQERCIDLSTSPGFPSHVELFRKGQRRLDLNSSPAVGLFDKDGRPRAQLQFSQEPSLLLLDEKGQQVPQKQ